jgi:WD40 repeat protein
VGHRNTRRDYNLELLVQARARLDAEDRAGAYRVLQRVAVEFRGWAWHHLLLQAEGSGQAVRILRRPGWGGVGPIAFSRDSQLLASLGSNGPIYFWHVGTGKGLRNFALAAHEGWPQVTAFSANGRIAAAVYVRPPKAPGPAPKGEKIVPLPKNAARVDPFEIAAQVGPPIKGAPAAPESPPTVVVIWNAVSGEKLHTLDGPAGHQVHLQLSGDGGRVLVAAHDWNQPAEVRVFDTTTGKELLKPRKRLTNLRQFVFSPDGKMVATISGDWTKPPVISFQDVDSGKESVTLEGKSEGIEQIVFSPDGKLIVAAGGGEKMMTVSETYPVKEKRTRKRPDGKLEVYEVTVNKKVTKMVKVAGGDSKLRIWSAGSGKLLHTFASCGGHSPAMAVSPDGTLLARLCHGACTPGLELYLFDLRLGRLMLQLPVPQGLHLDQLVFSPDGRYLAGAQRGSDQVVLWSSTGGRLLYQYDRHGAPVTDLVFSPDGTLLSSYSACNGAARVWAVRTGKDLVVAQTGVGGHSYGYGVYGATGYGGYGSWGVGAALAFSADGRRLMFPVIGSASVWDRKAGKPIEFPKDVGQVLAVSPDGTLIVTAPEPKPIVPPAEPPAEAEKAPPATTGANPCSCGTPTPAPYCAPSRRTRRA